MLCKTHHKVMKNSTLSQTDLSPREMFILKKNQINNLKNKYIFKDSEFHKSRGIFPQRFIKFRL